MFTSRAGIGTTAILTEKSCTNQGFQSIVPKDKCLDSYFIYSFTPYLKKYAEIKGSGSTFVEVSGKQMADMPLKLPRLYEEQVNIGTLFRFLDDLITLHQRKFFNWLLKFELNLIGLFYSWEQRKYEQIFAYERPDKYIVKSDKYVDDAPTPVLTANKGFVLGYTEETNTYKNPCIIFDDFTLDNKLVNFDFMVKSSAMKILTAKPDYDLNFSYSRLQSTKIEVLGHARHYISVVQKTSVYCPKIAEQKLIGTLFDKLDSLITLHQR